MEEENQIPKVKPLNEGIEKAQTKPMRDSQPPPPPPSPQKESAPPPPPPPPTSNEWYSINKLVHT